MRILQALAWLIAAAVGLAVLCAVRCAQALPQVKPRPTVEVTYEPSEVQFSNITGPGMHDAAMSISVKVDTNCNIAGLVLDATALTLVEPFPGDPLGDPAPTIPTSRLFIKATGMNDYVALSQPVLVMPPKGPGHYETKLYFRVNVINDDPPGRYPGAVNVSCFPAP
jgi:hypothetical protein